MSGSSDPLGELAENPINLGPIVQVHLNIGAAARLIKLVSLAAATEAASELVAGANLGPGASLRHQNERKCHSQLD